MRATRVIAAVLVLALAAVAAACGIPSDDQPRAIPPEAMPSNQRIDATTTIPSQDSSGTFTQTIYLVRTDSGSGAADERLEAVQVDLSTTPAGADDVARLVLTRLAEYNPEESGRTGLTNAVPPGTKVLDATVQDGVLQLNLSQEFAEVESTGQRLAVAQIVFTATEQGDINGVIFHIEGEPVAVPTEGGNADAGQTVTRDDYPRFAAQVQAAADSPGSG